MRLVKIAFFASTLLFLGALFFHKISEFDQDLGRHLLMGKMIWQQGEVPKANLLSYTYPNFEFVNSHWLSEAIFYQVVNFFNSVQSLLYLKTIILVASFGLTVYTAYRFSRSLAATAFSLAIFVPILLERTEIRPEIFSYLFVAIFLYVLLLDKKRLFWLLPIIEVVWVNAHIYFIVGPILLAIFSWNRKDRWPMALLVWLTTLLNPNGLAGATYPLHVFDNYGYTIVENQNIFFLREMVFNPNIFYFGVAFILFAVSFIMTDWKKVTVITLGLASLAFLPVMAIRSFPFFFLLELPVVAYNLAHLNPRARNFLDRQLGNLRPVVPQLIVALVIFVNLIRCLRLVSNDYYLTIDSTKRFGAEVQESGKGALDFIQQNGLHGPIFNNFDIGSYIAYRLYPQEKVFVDGRPEAYPAAFFQNLYIPMQQSAENFEKVDAVYKFKVIIFAHTDATPWGQQFLSFIIKDPKYQLVYLDDYALVFVNRDAFPQAAKNFAVTPQALISNDQADYSGRNFLSLAQVASTFGWNDGAIKFLQRAYALNPGSPQVLQAIGMAYSQNQTMVILGQKYLADYHDKTRLILF